MRRSSNPAEGQRLRVENAYQQWGEDLFNAGWTTYFLTFMFERLKGTESAMLRQMEQELERVYSTHLTYVHRCPNARSMIGKQPVWICAPDLPVFKHGKQALEDLVVNDGLHVHATAFYHPHARRDFDLEAHLADRRYKYSGSGHLLQRIDVRPVSDDADYVVGYGRKSVTKGRIAEEASFVLPRCRSELPSGLIEGQNGSHSRALPSAHIRR